MAAGGLFIALVLQISVVTAIGRVASVMVLFLGILMLILGILTHFLCASFFEAKSALVLYTYVFSCLSMVF